MSCEHKPIDITIEYLGALTRLHAKCDKCGAPLFYEIEGEEWGVQGDRSAPEPEDWQEAIETIDSLLSRIEDLPGAADEFASHAQDFLNSVRDWIEEREVVTSNHLEAFGRWGAAVSRWER